jgi:hypothetical protein
MKREAQHVIILSLTVVIFIHYFYHCIYLHIGAMHALIEQDRERPISRPDIVRTSVYCLRLKMSGRGQKLLVALRMVPKAAPRNSVSSVVGFLSIHQAISILNEGRVVAVRVWIWGYELRV